MYDKSLAVEILIQILNASKIVAQRFEIVDSIDYFIDTPEGQEKLDSICMQLIAIGESLKNIDKITDKKLLEKYPQVDWKGAKGIRDIISHHYFDLDAEEIYFVCDTKLDTLIKTIETILKDLK
ncbi:MAG: HepT-like ribonuclease domain-containing protein [Campylobacterota bacterium]|nr:HepT-like ribonuclease domain-containing protein [Campylobacterota bacterium]